MTDCEHLQRTSMYFDGELAPAEERDAADHLATCAQCQLLLGDAVAMVAALSRVSTSAARFTSRRRWQLAIGAAALVAAAIAIIVLRPKPAARDDKPITLVLAEKRSIEARFTGEQLGKHRPYEVPTDRAREAIDSRALEDLEKRGQVRDLVGALASAGELTTAKALAARSGDPAAHSDLAAIALAAGDAEGALAHAYRALDRDPNLTAARWNLGLAAHKLRLWRLGRESFRAVVARAELGWASEAEQHVSLAERELARPAEIERMRGHFQLLVAAGSVRNTITDPAMRDRANLIEFQRRSRAIIEWETVIDLDLVRAYPSHAWLFLYESLTAATPGIVEGLEPVAEEIDKIAKTTAAFDLLKRAVRDRAKIARIVPLAKPTPELATLAEGDPFVELFALGDVDALPDRCGNEAFALPCARLAQELARKQLAAGTVDEAVRTGELAADAARRTQQAFDYELLAQIHERAGRQALARAERDEARLAR